MSQAHRERLERRARELQEQIRRELRQGNLSYVQAELVWRLMRTEKQIEELKSYEQTTNNRKTGRSHGTT